jgi:hypothetical protein
MIALNFPQPGQQLLMIGAARDRAAALALAGDAAPAPHAKSFEALE